MNYAKKLDADGPSSRSYPRVNWSLRFCFQRLLLSRWLPSAQVELLVELVKMVLGTSIARHFLRDHPLISRTHSRLKGLGALKSVRFITE